MTTMEKEEIIKKLLEDDFDYIRNNNSGDEYLEQLLINGFMGYNNQTIEELKSELKAREL